MKKKLSVLAIVLVVCMIFSVFGGCSAKENGDNEKDQSKQNSNENKNNEESENENSDQNKKNDKNNDKNNEKSQDEEVNPYAEKITVKMIHRFFSHNAQPLVEDDKVVEFLEKKFNMDLELMYVPSPKQSEVYEKLNMMISTGEIPDVMEVNLDDQLSKTIVETLAKNNKLINMENFVAENEGRYPNINGNLTHPHAEAYRMLDGNIYAMPRTLGRWPHAWFVRKDWLEKLDIDTPQTLDDIYEMLKLFVEKDPDGQRNIGWSQGTLWWFNHVYASFTGAAYYAVRDGDYHSVWTLPEQKEGIKWVHKLYEEGLIDPDVLINKNQVDEQAKFSSGRAGLIINPIKFVSKFGEDLKQYREDASVDVLPVNIQGPKAIARISGLDFYEGIAIKKDTKDPQRILDLIEYLFTEEGQNLYNNGVEGVHYTKDSSGKIIKEEEILSYEGWGIEGKQPEHAIRMLITQVETHSADGYSPELGERYFSELNSLTNIPTKPLDLYAPMEVLKEVGSAPGDVIDRYHAQFVTGELDIDDYWDDFQKEYWDAGYGKIHEYINKTFEP